MKIKKAVGKYIAARDRIKEIKAGHAEELRPYFEGQTKLEAKFMKFMNKNEANNIASDFGTVYRATQISDTISDWNLFIKYVAKHKLWHMLTKKPASSAMTEFLEEEDALPPGVTRKSSYTVNVRRK